MTEQERDRIIDDEHMRLLALGHYITGGLCIAFASLFIFHFVFIAFFAANPELFGPASPPHGPPDGMLKVFAPSSWRA